MSKILVVLTDVKSLETWENDAFYPVATHTIVSSKPLLQHVFDEPNFINLPRCDILKQITKLYEFAKMHNDTDFVIQFTMNQDPNHWSGSDLIDMFRGYPSNITFQDDTVTWFVNKTKRAF